MQVAQSDESGEKEGKITDDLPPQIGKTAEQTLGEVGKRQECGQQEERPLDDAALRLHHIAVSRRRIGPGPASAIEEIAVAPFPARRFRSVQ